MKVAVYFLLVFIITFIIPGCDKSQKAQSSVKPMLSESNQVNKKKVDKKIISKEKTDSDLKHLRKWIGKYPINPKDTKFNNFFSLKEVKIVLLGVLGQNGFEKLLKHFHGYDLIYEKSGFLVMLGTTDKNDNQDVNYALVAIKVETGETHIYFSDNKKLSNFSNVSENKKLPIEIKEDILIQTDAAQTLIIEKFPPKTEDFACYAVLYEDWNVIASKRQYVFITNDKGGIVKIEGKKQNVVLIESTEVKKESGNTTVVWIYENNDVRAVFDLSLKKLLNEGSDIIYDGTLKIATQHKTQSISVKAFCGG